jgi:hypothetical protein
MRNANIGDPGEVFGTGEINLEGHDDAGGANTKRWRCEVRGFCRGKGRAILGEQYWPREKIGLQNLTVSVY